jgi:pimeloyl-ACP methyl ester carboxylesterase
MQNNSLKYTAEELAKKGIASLRFDKRGVGQSTEIEKDEYTLRFETFVNDVRAWVDLLHKDKRFSKIIIAGHSEGSLLGMLAAADNKKVSAFVSIAGPGRPLDVILKEQLKDVQVDARNTMYGYIDKLRKGDTLGEVPPIFYGLFRPSVQPYMSSMMKYDPQEVIQKLSVPVLILQGSTDIQVKEEDARALHAAKPDAKLVVVKDMNHVLKDCTVLDKKEQLKFYDNADLPLNKEYVAALTAFLLAL